MGLGWELPETVYNESREFLDHRRKRAAREGSLGFKLPDGGPPAFVKLQVPGKSKRGRCILLPKSGRWVRRTIAGKVPSGATLWVVARGPEVLCGSVSGVTARRSVSQRACNVMLSGFPRSVERSSGSWRRSGTGGRLG